MGAQGSSSANAWLSGYLERWLYICRNARRPAVVPRKGSYVLLGVLIFCRMAFWTIFYIDVHQFSIITELLGTPPDDVIATICSETVSVSSQIWVTQKRMTDWDPGVDATLRQKPSKERSCTVQPTVCWPGYASYRFAGEDAHVWSSKAHYCSWSSCSSIPCSLPWSIRWTRSTGKIWLVIQRGRPSRWHVERYV